MNTELYRIKDLIFSYGQKKKSLQSEPVLQIPEMTIRKNRVTVIRGHNGSGKSTLLKLLNGLLSPTRGEIQYSKPLRSVLVHQEPYLFHGTVLHNLTAPLHFQKNRLPGEYEKALSALRMVDLGGFEKRKAQELSGGEKKRIAIARALMTNPDVLLLDEPDANVDDKTSRVLETLIGELKDQGISTVLCSHDRGFAYRCCDDLIELYQGCPADHNENIFKGIYRYNSGLFSEFAIGDWFIQCPSLAGNYTTAVIPPESITLLPEAREEMKGNICKAVIRNISSSKMGLQTLFLTGETTLRMYISDVELSLLGLKTGDEVTLIFNPSSVKLY